MKTRKLILLNALLVLLVAGMSSCTYNDLVSKETEVEEQWSNVENQYQRRSDLIPNLVNTVKGAANFEKSTLTDVMKARASATKVTVDPTKLNPEAIQKFQASQGQLSQALGRLMMVSERYPKLQATESFKGLQAQLEGTENRIAVARRDFNTSVSNYNKAIRKFPGVIYASLFGFEKKGFFEAEDGAEEAPTVDFGSDSSE